MKNIQIFCVSKEELEEKLFDYLTNDNKNSLIRFDSKNGEFYFYSKINHNIERVNVFADILEYDEKLVLNLKEILNFSFNQIGAISNEDHGPFDKKIIYAPIENYVNYCSYESNVPSSIFHFVANLFYKYASGHLMKNGNKRLSFLFMINTLYYFGFYFFYSKGQLVNYEKYEEKLVEWVERTNNLIINNGHSGLEKYINELAEWIKENSIIALKWIQK